MTWKQIPVFFSIISTKKYDLGTNSDTFSNNIHKNVLLAQWHRGMWEKSFTWWTNPKAPWPSNRPRRSSFSLKMRSLEVLGLASVGVNGPDSSMLANFSISRRFFFLVFSLLKLTQAKMTAPIKGIPRPMDKPMVIFFFFISSLQTNENVSQLRSINHPINQSIHRLINQTINPSIDWSI